MSSTDEKLNLILYRLDDFIYRMAALERASCTSPIQYKPFESDDDDDDDEPCKMCGA